MKFTTVAALLLVALFALSDATNSNPLCMMCTGIISMPEDWASAQELLRYGCSKLGSAKTPCENLVNAADLTSSYPNMYPYIIELKDIGCQKYCQES